MICENVSAMELSSTEPIELTQSDDTAGKLKIPAVLLQFENCNSTIPAAF